MKQTIYLSVDRWGVNRMTKSLPTLRRGEIPVKVILEVEESAFREPVIEKEILIQDWRQGIDIADVEFKEATITEEEAELIRAERMKKLREMLESKGYKITEPEAL